MRIGFVKLWAMLALTAAVSTGAQAGAAPAAEQPIALETAGGAVHGTLRLPEGAGKAPVVLIVAGAAPPRWTSRSCASIPTSTMPQPGSPG